MVNAFLFLLSLAAPLPALADDIATPYSGRDNAIGLIINDFNAQDNHLKTADEIEKYHRCLLSDKAERASEAAYESRYRFFIAQALESFGVPDGMLTCLCGRESRFGATAVNGESSATGICQSLADSLSDVERWRKTMPAVKESWESYVTHLGNKLEDPACAGQPLSPGLLKRCPSLGLGVAAIYLKFVYSRVEKDKDFGEATWSAQSVDTLTTVAGGYYAGAGVVEKALHKEPDSARWNLALMQEECVEAKADNRTPEWMHIRLSTLRNEMQAVRNCLMAGTWLDHQGKPMTGECASPDTAEQLKALEKFRDSLPVTCN